MPKEKFNSRHILDKFILYFEGDKPFTPSEKRMLGIKLSQLRKNVKDYIESNNIETDLSINEIIMDTIEYSKMMNYNFRSIASLGYNVLGDSIKYWRKRREIIAMKEKENDKFHNQNDHYSVDKVITYEYNKINSRNRSPKWMNNNKW
ncbi:hypothetical protein [Bacillus sp. LMB3902]|uniref:hypothetical protein n=1 Tax=Bacillus sp. LMB3902 TaxID=3139827 RepID=UPI00318F1044